MRKVNHRGQHPYKHSSREVRYNDPALPTVGLALDNILSILSGVSLQWKDPVADRASLPLTGNVLNDARVVQDDGDGKPAVYVCTATTGTVDQQWQKIADVDWGGNETVSISNADSPYTATADKRTIFVDTSSGNVVVDLPDAALSTDLDYTIKKTTNDTNQVVITPAGANLIDGSASLIIGGFLDSATMVCDGTNWNII